MALLLRVRDHSWILITGVILALVGARAYSADASPEAPGTDRALIIVGLPGDEAHAELFGRVVERWKDWLTGPLGFESKNVRILGGTGPDSVPATREAISGEAAALKQAVSPRDRVWVLWLGHANLDEGHGFLHLPGPDLRDDQFGALFRGLACREQVFWITSACSGWFIPALSAPGRVVITATERDREINETEFPMALAATVNRPPNEVDTNKDGKVSLLELFRTTVIEVGARYGADARVPTEHAQLDDNGDGKGTEDPNPKTDASDGALAARTILPWRR